MMNTSSSPSESFVQNPFANDQKAAEMIRACTPPQRALLCHLAFARLNQINPGSIIAALGQEQGRRYKAKLVGISELLTAGGDVTTSLQKFPGALPPQCVLAIELAEQKNEAMELYDNILQRSSAAVVGIHVANENEINFFGLLVRWFFIVLLIIFIALKILPEHMKILEEFSVKTPSLLGLVSNLLDTVARFWYVVPLMIFVAIPFCIPFLRNLIRRWSPTNWRHPRLDMKQIARQQLAMVIEAALPMRQGVQAIMRTPFASSNQTRKQKKRWLKVKSLTEMGKGIWDSLSTTKIISKRESNALKLSEASETQAWLLRWSNESNLDGRGVRMFVFARVIITMVHTLMAIIVALTAFAIFQTLTAVIGMAGS